MLAFSKLHQFKRRFILTAHAIPKIKSTMNLEREILEIGKQLGKFINEERTIDFDGVVDLLNRLNGLPITLELLQRTRIATTVNILRKKLIEWNSDTHVTCSSLINSWIQKCFPGEKRKIKLESSQPDGGRQPVTQPVAVILNSDDGNLLLRSQGQPCAGQPGSDDADNEDEDDDDDDDDNDGDDNDDADALLKNRQNPSVSNMNAFLNWKLPQPHQLAQPLSIRLEKGAQTNAYEALRSRVIIASTKREERLLSELAQTRKTLDDKVRTADELQRTVEELQEARKTVEGELRQERIALANERRLRQQEQRRIMEEVNRQKTAFVQYIRKIKANEDRHLSIERELRSAVSTENQQKTALEVRLRNLEEQMEEERNGHLSIERELRSAVSAADHRLQEGNQQKTALEQSLRNLEQRMEEQRNSHLSIERELRSTVSAENQQKTALEQRVRSLEERLEEERNSHLSTERELQSAMSAENQQKTALEERVRSLEGQMEEERNSHLTAQRNLQSAVPAAEHALEEYQRHQSRDWIIHREEVVLSETVLGRGAWGIVREGTFRGCQVAVKKIHELILSDYNRGRFEREMSIASRCRHPSLLQFIGATNDEGSPLFVTELLDTSLRHVLHQCTLNHGEIVTLALDVARGLNYLHLNRPVPIMHRDISSANVLLWRRDESLRAKLSDYGAANFLRQSMTVNPGALIYSAPEAFTPQQSTKVDVYSFGVLLCEMCIREQPDRQKLRDQMSRVTQGALKGLIRQCTRRHPEKRPTMSEVIHELEQLV